MVTIPESFIGHTILNDLGEALKLQKIGEKIEAFVSLIRFHFQLLEKEKKVILKS